MGVVHVEGKPITLDDAIIGAGTEAIRDALAVDFPDIENAEISIAGVESARSPAIVTSRSATVVKRATPKG
jgi:hypothetical protein